MEIFTCEDCVQYDVAYQDAFTDWCHRKQGELNCYEMSKNRNVDPYTRGYCRGFILRGAESEFEF